MYFNVVHQFSLWNLLASPNHDHIVYRYSPVLYARHRLKQERPEWLPETSDEPERSCRLVKRSRTIHELLVEQGGSVDGRGKYRPSQSSCLLSGDTPKRRRRHMYTSGTVLPSGPEMQTTW